MLFLSTNILQITNNLDLIVLPYKCLTPKQIPEIKKILMVFTYGQFCLLNLVFIFQCKCDH